MFDFWVFQMVIPFLEATKEPIEFELRKGDIDIKVSLSSKKGSMHCNLFVLSNVSFRGWMDLSCVRCGSIFKYTLSEDTSFLIHQGLFKATSNEHLDIIEVMSDSIDLDEILSSELESIKSDYVYCEACKLEQ